MNQIPPITKNLLIINVLFFLASIVAPKYGVDLTTLLGLHYFMASDFHIYQFVTYMFMHGGFAHLFFNMFALWMFGCTLERVFGPKRYLIYYMVCGLGAGLIQEVVQYIEYLTVLSNFDSVNTGISIIPMSEGKLGLLVAMEGDTIRGIITDGDLRRIMQRWHARFFDLQVKDVMTPNPKRIHPDMKIAEAEQLLNRYKIHSLLVVDEDDHLVGIVDNFSCML